MRRTKAVAGLVSRLIRTVKLIATDGRIPRPLRLLVAIGLVPVPGPFDEAILLAAAVPLLIFYRPLMRDAWRQTDETHLTDG
jgi:hypothetical protein